MFYAYRIRFVVCFFLATITIGEIKMNNQNSLKTSGAFAAHDKLEKPVILEWIKTSILSSDFSQSMKNMWDIARPAYTPVEMQFLKAFPDLVQNDPYFTPLESLFKNGIANVDWKLVEENMQAMLKSHFIFDATTWPEEITKKYAHDICYFVSVKDAKTHELVGFITFLKRKEYPQETIKVMSFAVHPEHQNRGLGKILMSSIFNIEPTIQRVFLCTRVTNDMALRAYRSWGFVHDENTILDHTFNLDHWTFMEYKTKQSNILQKTAEAVIK